VERALKRKGVQNEAKTKKEREVADSMIEWANAEGRDVLIEKEKLIGE